MKNKSFIVIFLLVVVIVVAAAFFYFKTEDDKKNSSTGDENKVVFNDTQKKLVKKIESKFKTKDYFDLDNLDDFEVVKLQKIGYYKSEKDYYYAIVNYNALCIDGTLDCDNLCENKYLLGATGEPFNFYIKVNSKTLDVEKVPQVIINSTNEDDWVKDDSEIK